MNYISLLVDFRRQRRIAPIGKNAILLYFILWEYINEYRLPTEGFTASNSALQANSGLSRRDLDNARNELKLNGYIGYKKGSGNQSGAYSIVRFDTQTDTQNDTLIDTQTGTQDDTQVGTQIHHINITKQNITKDHTSLTPLDGGVDKKNVSSSDVKVMLRAVWEKYPFDPKLDSVLKEWIKYKAEKKKVYKPQGLNVLLSQTKSNAEKYGDEAIISLIHQSMANGYDGIIWDKLNATVKPVISVGRYENYRDLGEV